MEPQTTKPWHKLGRGDIIRNKTTGELALVVHTWTQYYQDADSYRYAHEHGVADTAVRIQWIESGHEHTFRWTQLRSLWEVQCK